ncbi:MAG: class I SAM-dependent methyltransferase [Gemmatimonadota bacterium]|nr:class I SAM-dependent methyltransferase [Gemmatimonadota bacterium]
MTAHSGWDGEIMSASILDLLRCPTCAQSVRSGSGGWECSGCGTRGRIDAAGIVHLHIGTDESIFAPTANTLEGYGWDAVLQAGSRRELARALARPIAALRSDRPGEYWDFQSYFASSRYGFAVLGATYRGTVSLVLGSAWGGLLRVITQLGGHAVGVESRYEGLFYSSMAGNGSSQHLVHAHSGTQLPFGDHSFDNVFLDGLPRVADDHPGARSAHHALLRDCVRLLKPGGRVVLRVDNEASPWRRAAVGPFPEPAGPRPDGAGSSRMREHLRRPWRGRSWTRHEISVLLRGAGFDGLEFSLLWPDPVRWTRLILPRGSAAVEAFDRPANSWSSKAARHVLRSLVRCGAARDLPPGYCIVARSAPGPGSRSSTLDTISEKRGIDASQIRTVECHPNSKSISFSVGGCFVKVPLAERSYRLQRTGAAALAKTAAEHTQLGSLAVQVEFRKAKGAAFSVYPFIAFKQSNELRDRVSRLEAAFQQITADARDVPLRSTDFWQRLTAQETRAELGQLGAEGLLQWAERYLASRVVPAGVVHGDLAYCNLVRDMSGSVVALDWDRCEYLSPKLLDAMHGCHSLARGHHGTLAPDRRGESGILLAWRLLWERHPALPLLERVDAVRGELTWREAILVAMLDEVERQLRATRSNPVSRLSAEPMIRARISLAQQVLLIAAGE